MGHYKKSCRGAGILLPVYSRPERKQLEADGRFISAHRAVLAAASPYFRAMLSGKFKETKEEVVPIKEVTFQGLSAVIECIYTTNLVLNMENIEHILPAAHLFQMNDVVRECVEWMDKNRKQQKTVFDS